MSRSLRIKAARRVRGKLKAPGDKSISHRIAMLASIARGATRIKGFATSADCHSTIDCLRRLGAEIETRDDEIVVHGQGLRGFRPQSATAKLDAGNSGSTIRMLSGILAAQLFSTEIDGDESLRRRPMRRIIEPLTLMGSKIEARSAAFPPLLIHGTDLKPIAYESRVASAQVKSCVLLAGLHAEGKTIFKEPALSRNHSEIMLKEFGAGIVVDESGFDITIQGGAELAPLDYEVPGDISSAAFLIAAAAVMEGSEVLLNDVCLNPTRTAFLDVLLSLGANLETHNGRKQHGEIIGDLLVSGNYLKTEKGELLLKGALIPNIIDELPILAVVASQTEGRIEVRDARELRVKESDRIRPIVDAIKAMGGEIEEFDDGFAINGPQRLRGGRVETGGDHRIAMAFSVAALVAEGSTEILDAECASVSFPEFYRTLDALTEGAAFE
jgi:3-phosphoshikimate 1-carboxyvinyltransferase